MYVYIYIGIHTHTHTLAALGNKRSLTGSQASNGKADLAADAGNHSQARHSEGGTGNISKKGEAYLWYPNRDMYMYVNISISMWVMYVYVESYIDI